MPHAAPPRSDAARGPCLRQATADPSLRRKPSDPGRAGTALVGSLLLSLGPGAHGFFGVCPPRVSGGSEV